MRRLRCGAVRAHVGLRDLLISAASAVLAATPVPPFLAPFGRATTWKGGPLKRALRDEGDAGDSGRTYRCRPHDQKSCTSERFRSDPKQDEGGLETALAELYRTIRDY